MDFCCGGRGRGRKTVVSVYTFPSPHGREQNFPGHLNPTEGSKEPSEELIYIFWNLRDIGEAS